MILVPRHPTKEMIEAAYWSAYNEDAAGVWQDMIQTWLTSNRGNSESGKD